MKRRPGHPKRIRHDHDPGHVHELSFSCYHRWPLLTNDVWRGMLAESIDRAMEGHRYRLSAFVLMPAHVHLSVFPLAVAGSTDGLLKAIKRPFSYRPGYDRDFIKRSTALAAIDYVHHNPVRRGIVKRAVDWK